MKNECMAIKNTISAVAVVLLWFVWSYSAAQEAVDTVVFPDDFKSEADYIRYENKTLVLTAYAKSIPPTPTKPPTNARRTPPFTPSWPIQTTLQNRKAA